MSNRWQSGQRSSRIYVTEGQERKNLDVDIRLKEEAAKEADITYAFGENGASLAKRESVETVGAERDSPPHLFPPFIMSRFYPGSWPQTKKLGSAPSLRERFIRSPRMRHTSWSR